MIIACKICNKLFKPRSNSITICDNCKTLTCEICGKVYFAKRIRDVYSKHKYCGWECACKGRCITRRTERKYWNNSGKPKWQLYYENSKRWYSKSHYYDGYRLCIDTDLCIYGPNGKQTIYQYIWEKYNGPIPDGYVIHHKDGNHRNHCLPNLQLMTRAEHIKIHRINRWGYPDPVKEGDG